MRRRGWTRPGGHSGMPARAAPFAAGPAPPRLQPAPRYNVNPWLGHVGLMSRSSQAPLLLFKVL